MKLYLLLFCFGSFIFLTHGDDVPTKEEPKETPTDVKPKETSPPICLKCDCNNSTKTLDCSRKNLTEWLTDDEWHQVNRSSFEIVLLDNNNFDEIKVIPDIGVKKLVLSNNRITTIEKGAFQNLQDLEILDLSNNNLTVATLDPVAFEGRYNPHSYEPIPNLKELNLGYNQLHSLNADLFEHFPALETLILNDNVFKIIDQLTVMAISSIPTLKNLDLSYLELREIPEHIFHAPQFLENLNLKGNLFKKIPSALVYTMNLKYLNMDENPFENFGGDNVFPEMKSLENLSLSYLPDITKIGNGTFSGLTKLKELNMQRNLHLAEIDPAAFSRESLNSSEKLESLTTVEKINLNHNSLTLLNQELLHRWDKITIDIRENPWDCQCENEWLIHILYKTIRENNPDLSVNLACSSPARLNGVKFEKIHMDKNILLCPNKYGNNPEGDGRLLMGMLIGLLIGIPIALGILMIYRRGCFNLLGSYRNENSRALYKRADFNDDYQI